MATESPTMNATQPPPPNGPAAAPTPPTEQARPEPKSRVGYGRAGVILESLAELWRFAELVYKSGLAPDGLDSIEKVAVAIQYGAEFSVPPMASVRGIAVINGLPGWKGDMALGLVIASGRLAEWETHYEGEEGSEDYKAVFTSRRVDQAKPRVHEFSVKDAKTALLWGRTGRNGQPTPWVTYPKRMLYYRALGFNLRDNFPDVMNGAAIAEEMADIPVKHVGSGSTQQNAQRALPAASTPTLVIDPLLESLGVKPEPVAEPVPVKARDDEGGSTAGPGKAAASAQVCLHLALPDPIPAGKAFVCVDCGEKLRGPEKKVEGAPCCGGSHGPGEPCGKEMRTAASAKRSK